MAETDATVNESDVADVEPVGPVARVTAITKDAPDWVKKFETAAKFSGNFALAIAQICEAIEAVVGGIGSGFRAAATRIGTVKNRRNA